MKKNQLTILLSATFLVLLINSSCTLSKTDQLEPMKTTETLVLTPTLMSSPVSEGTTIPSCRSNLIRLNDLIPNVQINSYRWSDDGEYIYIQSGMDWWEYSVKGQEIVSVSNPNVTATRTSFPIEETYRAILGDDYDFLHHSSSLSPDGTILLYWNVTDRLKLPTSSPDPNSQANENFNGSSFEHILLLQEGEADAVDIGSIPGGIAKAYWIPGKDQVVLEMLASSPYYLWLLDVPARSLTPLLSKADTSNAPKFTVLDISPDGNQVMYQTSIADYIFIKNIGDSSIQPVYAIPRNIGAWWLPDGKRIVAVVDAGPGYYSVYLYDAGTDEMTRIASDLERGGTASLLNASQNEVILAYARSQQSGLDVIDVLNLCLDTVK